MSFKLKLKKNNISFYEFVEPDIGFGITSIAVEPSDKTKKLCSSFPLAGKSSHVTPLNLSLIHEYVDIMQRCFQTKGVSILDHGLMVENILFSDLIPFLKSEKLVLDYKIPDWLSNNKQKILFSLPSEYTLRKYTRFHDIGKPWCSTIDEHGKQHFPNHSKESQKRYLDIFPAEILVGELIFHDMDIHKLKDCQVEDFVKSNKNYLTHLLVGFAEIIANSSMFGGMETENYKIKYKQLERRGNAIFRAIKAPSPALTA